MEEIELVDEDVRFSLPSELTDLDPMSASVQIGNALESAAEQAMRRAASYLAGLQQRDGHWCAELTADTTLESDYILFQLWLDPPRGRRLAAGHAAADRQGGALDSGPPACPMAASTSTCNGPSEVSASVKAYFALKLAGMPAADPRMARLRDRILELGGIQAANSYVKVNLSLFDLYPAAILPEHSSRGGAAAVRISCTRCRRGRAPSWSRSPSCMPPTRAGRCPPGSTWMSCGCPA